MGPNRRVQALFRPEDVTVVAAAGTLACEQLGRGVVEEIIFGGSYERLRVRMPALTGVRMIAPPLFFGGDSLLVEAMRSQEEARRCPLQPGQEVCVGVNRIHALDHPGLRFLVLSDGSPAAQAAGLAVACQIARLAQARVRLLGCGKEGSSLEQHLQEAKEKYGGSLVAFDTRMSAGPPAAAVAREVERRHYDLLVAGTGPSPDASLVARVLQSGEHHLLLVPGAHPTPARVLICVASGEPGKEDVMFAGRLVRHLGAEATVLAVVPAGESDPAARARAQRFVRNGERALALFGIRAQTAVRTGDIYAEILKEMESGSYDMLVLGAPLPGLDGTISLAGVVGEILRDPVAHPVLIVRSTAAGRPELAYAGPHAHSAKVTEIVE
jgi:sulfate/thiosulfate transport system ATP-binding protein